MATSKHDFNFPTRRVTAEFTLTKSDEKTKTLVAFVPLYESEHIQHCSMSFLGDKKEEPLSAIVQSISFSSIDHETLTGATLNVRNGLLGIRSTYDMSHARMHVTLLHGEYTPLPTSSIFRVTLVLNLLTPQELKQTFSAKENADLFHDPELFVALTQPTQLLANRILYHSRISPICTKQIAVRYLDLDQFKNFSISFREALEKSIESENMRPTDIILQIWFSYNVAKIQTTSSMFQTLQLRHKNNIVHTYSSPVQLQVIDKSIWDLFSSDMNARGAQQKYQTITTGAVLLEQMKECELYFEVHKQFHTDFTNVVNEDKNKTANIEDALILVRFGFLYERMSE